MTEAAEAEAKVTTRDLEQMLREKYTRDRYALFFNVPDAVSLDARRRIDAVAVGIWKSVGREVQAFELKASRSDWLRELKHVDKADPFIKICDRFWLVTTDASIAKLEEIPACWGWMTATKNGLRVQRPAEKLPTDRDNMPWGFTLGLLRKLQDELLSSPDVQTAMASMMQNLKADYDANIERAKRSVSHDYAVLKDRVAKFEKESGIMLEDWAFGNCGHVVKRLSRLGYGAESGLDFVTEQLSFQAQQMERVIESTRQAEREIRESMKQRAAEPTRTGTP